MCNQLLPLLPLLLLVRVMNGHMGWRRLCVLPRVCACVAAATTCAICNTNPVSGSAQKTCMQLQQQQQHVRHKGQQRQWQHQLQGEVKKPSVYFVFDSHSHSLRADAVPDSFFFQGCWGNLSTRLASPATPPIVSVAYVCASADVAVAVAVGIAGSSSSGSTVSGS